MANKVIEMHIVRSVIQQLGRNYSERHISRELNISRTTVRQYAERFRTCSFTFTELLELEDAVLAELVYPSTLAPNRDDRKIDFESRIGYFQTELKRTGVTRYLLWQEYRSRYGGGYGYTQFCELLARHSTIQDASMHFDHPPAQMMMVDFAGDKLSYTDKGSGEVIFCPVLVCVLPFSSYSYVVALPNASIPQLVKALNSCLQYFGGVPMQLKTDNMKQMVSKSCRYEPVFTDMIQQWALHNNISLLATRVAKPKDKAMVEGSVKLAYQRIYAPLRDQVFFSIEALNAAVSEQLALHNNRLMHKKEHSRKQLFDTQEQPLLQSLPGQAFVLKHSVEAKVQKNYHIVLGEDWHYYSVPCAYTGKLVKAVYDTDIVELYHAHHRIATHKRSYKRHGYTTCNEHMPEAHRRYQQAWDPDYFQRQASAIGADTRQYVDKLLQSRQFSEQAFLACRGLLRLGKTYGNQRLEAACHRALQGQSYSYRIVNNILAKNLDTQPLPDITQSCFQLPLHDNLRGQSSFE